MTLLLTECSTAGIVMAADSAISMMKGGRVMQANKLQWKKVIRAPRISAAVGYWGLIGRVTSERFDDWLGRVVATAKYSDLPSLASAIADALNVACKGKPLAIDEAVGIHVAGYHRWQDGVDRPTFFHVVNGPGEFTIDHVRDSPTDPTRVTKVVPKWIAGQRTLFRANQDFPAAQRTLQENLASLELGYITRNGDFFYYAIVWEALRRAMDYLNLVDGVSFPRDPNKVSSRKGLVIAAIETMIRLYDCSSLPRIIGGKASAVAIDENGLLV